MFQMLSLLLSSIQQISVKCHENMRKDEHCTKYQHFTVRSFTVLSKLKALQLSKVGLSTIKHQHSKKSDTMGRCDLNQNT